MTPSMPATTRYRPSGENASMNTPPPNCGGYCVWSMTLNVLTLVQPGTDHTCMVVSCTAEMASRVPSGLNAMLLIRVAMPVCIVAVSFRVAGSHSWTESPVPVDATASVLPSGANASAAMPLTGITPASVRAGMRYTATPGPMAVVVLTASVVPSGENAAVSAPLAWPSIVAPWVSHSPMVPSSLALASVLPFGANVMCGTENRWPAYVP